MVTPKYVAGHIPRKLQQRDRAQTHQNGAYQGSSKTPQTKAATWNAGILTSDIN